MDDPVFMHYDILGDPFGRNFACDFEPAEGEHFGVTSEPKAATCPDCILRLESTNWRSDQ